MQSRMDREWERIIGRSHHHLVKTQSSASSSEDDELEDQAPLNGDELRSVAHGVPMSDELEDQAPLNDIIVHKFDLESISPMSAIWKYAWKFAVLQLLVFSVQIEDAVVVGRLSKEPSHLAAASVGRAFLNSSWFFLLGISSGLDFLCTDVSIGMVATILNF